ncbi:MAG: hypothetical protein AAF744_11920 [Pseudomonadota bacterium]
MGARAASGRLAALMAAWCAMVAPAFAQTDAAEPEPQRFSVEGETLTYDTTVLVNGRELDIRQSDVREMRALLRDNPGVTRLALRSTGGGHYPAMDMAALVIDFELDTHVEDFCESSCVTVFLGGAKRSMAKGARLGFHQLSWGANSVQDYYNKHRQRRGWDTPFDFAEWLYKDTQTETYTRLAYMVERGVDAEFAIQSLRRPDATMWFPYRSVLKAAGVITQ